MDTQIFFLIHSLASRWAILDIGGIFFAEFAIYILAVVVALMLVILPGPYGIMSILRAETRISLSRKILFIMLTAIAFALAVNASMGQVYFRERPFVAHTISPLIVIAKASKSFPSDHTATAFSIATVALLVRPRFGSICFIFALLIGIARIFVGVHYPGDIIAGAGVGMLSALFIFQLYSAWFPSIRTTLYGSTRARI